jgi:dTDP-4-dehydrorhamnose reductase
MNRIFITGGHGILGKELVKRFSINNTVFSPNSYECDITNLDQISNAVNQFNPNIIVHTAAYVDTFGCENNINKAININIIGTINLVKSIIEKNCRFVYISSEYVFGGYKGNYTIDDKLDPKNVYGKTKASSEYIVSILPDYQIIRSPFIRKIYPKVFTDQYCSRYFLDEAADKIVHNIINNKSKLIQISSNRESLYNLYISKGLNAEPITMDLNSLDIIPKDTSLINNSI